MMTINGTVNNTSMLQSMNNKWRQRTDGDEPLSEAEREERANWSEEERMVHDFEEQCADNREADRQTEITDKIMNGGSLTDSERKYLEQNNPQALKKYEEIQLEKKSYENKLKNCDTKDEVQCLKTETMSGYLTSLKKVVNNPYISKSEKLAKAKEMLAKTSNVRELEAKFMESAQYANMETEGEQATERTKENRSEDAYNMSDASAEKSDIQSDNEIDKTGKTDENAYLDKDYADEIKDIYEHMRISAGLSEFDGNGEFGNSGSTGAEINITV